MVAKMQSIGKVLEGERVFGQSTKSAKVSHITEREDQVIIFDDVRVWAKAGACRDRLVLEIDRFDIANVNVCAREQPANRADGVGDSYAAGNHFRQHRLKDKIVLFVDEYDLKIVATSQRLFEILRGVNASEPAPEDHHSFTTSFHINSR